MKNAPATFAEVGAICGYCLSPLDGSTPLLLFVLQISEQNRLRPDLSDMVISPHWSHDIIDRRNSSNLADIIKINSLSALSIFLLIASAVSSYFSKLSPICRMK